MITKILNWMGLGKKNVKVVKTEVESNKELTNDQLDFVVGGGKYDLHGNGYNSGNGNGNGPKNP